MRACSRTVERDNANAVCVMHAALTHKSSGWQSDRSRELCRIGRGCLRMGTDRSQRIRGCRNGDDHLCKAPEHVSNNLRANDMECMSCLENSFLPSDFFRMSTVSLREPKFVSCFNCNAEMSRNPLWSRPFAFDY